MTDTAASATPAAVASCRQTSASSNPLVFPAAVAVFAPLAPFVLLPPVPVLSDDGTGADYTAAATAAAGLRPCPVLPPLG